MDIPEIEIVSTIVLNSILVIGAFFGGIWAYHTFSSNENKAGLSINVKSVSSQKRKKNHIINAIVSVKNIGNRELDLKLDKTQMKLFLVKNGNYILEDSVNGRFSDSQNKGKNARIRSGVDYNFVYSFNVKSKGLYYLDFSLISDMDSYKSSLSLIISKITRLRNRILRRWFKIKARDKDVREITWVEKHYYYVK